jgi:protoporphyrinogen oxidase
LIIGAGPTGLGAGYRLAELGQCDFQIVDAAAQVGGLAASFIDNVGFTWDIGGHVQFSHYAYFDELMARSIGANDWFTHERESWVWMRERFVPYPLQNNLRYLPKEDIWRSVKGLLDLKRNVSGVKPKDFKEWLHATFGFGLTELFLEPYNLKVWAHSLDEMDYQWTSERVAVTELERALKNIICELDDLSWGPNNTFRFPKRGGTGAIWEAVADLVGRQHIKLDAEVTKIDPITKTAFLANGESINYKHLLTTMPIDRLVMTTDNMSRAARGLASVMRYSSSHIIGIGLGGAPPPSLTKKCWMYFPEDNCPFYRVTVFSNYSPYNVPDATCQWSLMAEVAESPFKPVDSATLIHNVLLGMRNTRLVSEDDPILSAWHYRAHYGYPTPFIGRDEVLRALHREFESMDISSRGRFGGWKYEVSNQDHSLMQGVEWVNRVVLGLPESTYRI